MVFSIFKNIIKSVLPASLWLNLRLFRETNINRKVAKDYIKQMLNDKSPITTQMDQHIIGACDVFEYKSILEVGSGGGRLSYWYLFNRKDFSGIEPDIWYRKLVNNFFYDMGFGKDRIQDGDIHNIQFDDNAFDIVTSNAVIEHIQDPVKAVNELFRVARRGCVITFPYGHEADSPDHIQHFYEKDVEELFSSYNYESSIVYDRPDGNRCYLVIIKKLGSV